MADLLTQLARGPELYPMALDPGRDALFFIRMTASDYREASFLDERMLAPDTRGQWVPFADVARAMSGEREIRPLHFIFHSGHVGSTLLSRLLDETGSVLSLREPLPLRTMAEAYDAQRGGREKHLETLLRLWERGFAETRAVVLKATSTAERLGSHLLALRPQARAVTLNVTAESYIAIMFAAENSAADLNAHGPERFHRLGRFLDAPPRPTSLGELAAMSWLVERLTQNELLRTFGERVLPLDFDTMLSALPVALAQVLDHLGLGVTKAELVAIAAGPALARYSKAPEHTYSPDIRARRLTDARQTFGNELRAALAWLDMLGRQSEAVASALQVNGPGS
jgi:hypothetical protein